MPESKIVEKQWSKEFEPAILKEWKEKELYKFSEKSKKPIFSIDTPPPYVNTPVHIGQVTTYAIMDMIARFKRMKGFEVLFPLGLDNNGLPIEMSAEKKFKIKVGITPREDFIKKCKQMLEESGIESTDSFYKSGISFNSWKKGTEIGEVYETDSPEYRALTQATFIELFKKGLIYEDDRVNNYCPGCRTTLADAEIEYQDKESLFNDIVFKCKETGEKLVVGTTRPELVCTCGMLAFNPEDERYRHLEGKTAITPIFEKEVPIKSHPIAQMDKGTGLVMMCSFGDLSDIRFFREQNLKSVIAISPDGLMNENAGFLKGSKPKEAREKMIQALKEKGLLAAQKPIVHSTPICERSKHEIEFVSMKEFYLKQLEFKEKMKELAMKLDFYAPKSRQIMLDWIESLSIDWPLSRRRYYATEVPLWYCKKCGFAFLPPKGKYYQPWKEKPPIEKCPKCGAMEWKGEERVFDTWFDSSNTPLYILQYSRNEKFFKKAKPCTLRPQGKEIIRTWLYYTVLKAYLLTGELIFKDAWINYHILDEKGNKMSKSVGNVIDPQEVLKRFGAEAFRLWAASEGNLERTDFNCSFERIEGMGKTLTKLWNASRFISSFGEPKEFKISQLESELDRWIISEANRIAEIAEMQYSNYDFHNPIVELKNFLWEAFASHYLEIAKSRAYNSEKEFSKKEQEQAVFTLNYCLDLMLKLWAPVNPIITFKIYKTLHGKDIHFEKFPKAEKVKAKIKTGELMQLDSEIWKAKKEKGLALNAEVKKAVLPEWAKPISKDLQKCHKIKELEFGKETRVEF